MNYTTMSRPELLTLCKQRGLSGAGTTEDLIERLQAQDDAAPPADQDEDPLADPETDDEPAPTPEPAAATPPAAPVSAPAAESVGDKPAKAGKAPEAAGPDPRVKEGPTGNVFRFEFYLDRDIDDIYHRHLIAETHHAAATAGYRTKGAPTVGHRLRYDQDGAGKRTAVYEVYLNGGQNGTRRP